MSDENQKKPQVVDGVWASGGDASKMPSDQVVEVSGGQVTGQTPPVTVSNTSNVSDGPVAGNHPAHPQPPTILQTCHPERQAVQPRSSN